ncbi:hypothetical protein SDC9_42380 [bioreactor metagenome]|uniref:Uncharacterized protein n=1 Tax=bioreactor metagenome TaxID=1076179 RepID=A0A644VXL1_9ZZZZ
MAPVGSALGGILAPGVEENAGHLAHVDGLGPSGHDKAGLVAGADEIEEGGLGVKAQLDLDAGLGELAGERLGDLAVVGVPAVGSVEVDLETVRISGFCEELLRLFGVVLRGGHVLHVSSPALQDHLVRGVGVAVHDHLHDGIPVDGQRQGFPNPEVREGVLVEPDDAGALGTMGVHVEIDQPLAGPVHHGKAFRVLQLVHVTDGNVLDDVHFAGQQGCRAGGGVADGTEGDLFDLRRSAPVLLIGLHGDMVFLDPLHEDVGTGAHGGLVEGGLAELCPVGLREDAQRGEGLEKDCRGGLGDDLHRIGIHDLNPVDGGGEVLQQRGAAHLDGVSHVLGGEVASVMEFHALFQAEGPGEIVVADGPGFGEGRPGNAEGVVVEKAVVHVPPHGVGDGLILLGRVHEERVRREADDDALLRGRRGGQGKAEREYCKESRKSFHSLIPPLFFCFGGPIINYSSPYR